MGLKPSIHRPRHPKHKARPFKDPSVVPSVIQQALRSAMATEGTPVAWYDDLLWIMAQESEGKVAVANGQGSTALGLFQLLKGNYAFFPNGQKSLGNAGEECQAGIRYIVARYHTAAAARAFWEKHHWY